MRKFKTLFLIFVLVLMVFMVACNGPEQPQPSGTTPSGTTPSGTVPDDPEPPFADSDPIEEEDPKVRIDKTEISILVGDSDVIKAQTLVQGATVTWKSLNPAICTVDKGVVVGISKGETEVSATVDGESVYCIVVVIERNNPASPIGYNIELNRDQIKLGPNESFNIEATLVDTNGIVKEDATFTYSSSVESVATVDTNGKIQAVSGGQTVMTVKYSDGTNWVTATMTVTVVDNWSVEIEPIEGEVEINGTYPIIYTVFKDGVAQDYPVDKVSITSSNDEVAEISGTNVITKSAGIAEISVELTELGIKSVYELIVIDADAGPIELKCDDIELYVDSSIKIPLTGATWGTIEYRLSDGDFSIVDDVIYAPSEEKTCTLTITHKETEQSINVNVNAIPFNPCITTANQFLALGSVKAGTEVYLDADIDLSEAVWSSKVGLTSEAPNAEEAFLVETLNAKLDGKGHKITVRYNHDFADHVRVAGVFHTVSTDGSITNLIIDSELRYFGPESADGNDTSPINYAMRNCVLAMKNFGKVTNNYIKARMYSDNFVKRETIVGFGGGTMKNNIVDIEVYKGGSVQNVGTFTWERSDRYASSQNVVISRTRTSAPSSVPLYFTSVQGFIDAWIGGTLDGKDTFVDGGWSVDSTTNTISLAGKVAHTEPFSGPVLAVNAQSVVNWSSVASATGYKIAVKWSDDTTWTELGTITDTKWDLTAYLKSLSVYDLIEKYDGTALTLGVATVTPNDTSEYSEINPMGMGALLRVATNIEELSNYTCATDTLNYTILVDNFDLGNVVKSTQQTFSIMGYMQKGTLNGLGHTIKYEYDDTYFTPSSGASFNGLFQKVGESHKVVILNLGVDAKITSARTFDDMHLNVLAYQLQGEVYNCYFKLRGYTTNISSSSKSRINLVRRLISNSNGTCTGSFDNCIFDMVTYGKDGIARQGGTATCDTLISRNESDIMTKSGTGRAIRNCAFIMNQTQDRTVWSEGDANVTITDSAFYSNYGAFVTAWNGDTLSGKQNYINAGFAVEGTAVKYNGIEINA